MKNKIKLLLSQLNHGLVERDYILKAGLLSVLSGENIVLIGPPGTGKSLIARRIAESLTHEENDLSYFEYLLTKFSTPEEIFGPLSITELKADRLKRNTTGYLPTVKFAFLDEIFKASSSILNSLLTILNERIYHNGATPQNVPLQSLISASNELPSDQDELGALYDRFLVRVFVDYVSKNNLHLLFEAAGEMPVLNQLTVTDLQTITTNAESITIPPKIIEAIQRIWLELKETFKEDRRENLSDRRLKKVIKLIRVSAATNGRNEVDFSDVFLLKDCLWNHPENAIKVRELILKALRSYSHQITLAHPHEEEAVEATMEKGDGASILPNKDTGKLNASVKGYKGSGTESDPILIENFHDLMGLEHPEVGHQGYYFRQTANIDCSELTSWMDINFNGHFDGKGFYIKYKKVSPGFFNMETKNLFSTIDHNSTVKSLYLKDLSLTEFAESCRIDHCISNSWLITANANNSEIAACESAKEIIAGTADKTVVYGCKAKGHLIGKHAKDSTITGCHAAKGLIKENADHCVIMDCEVILNDVLEREKDAGIALRLNRGSIVERCYVGGKLETSRSFYGITSSCQESSIRNCALGKLDKRLQLVGNISYRISPSNSKSIFENNISIDSNSGFTDSPANGKTVAAALFGQRYIENTLSWDFSQTWTWDNTNNRPTLQNIGVHAVPPSNKENTIQGETVDLLTEQIRTNIWL